MNNIRARGLQCLEFVVINMNAMSERDMFSADTKRIEITNVAHAGLALDQITFDFVFGCVSVNHDAALTRQTRDCAQQIAGATDCETRREAIANAAVISAVPGFQKIK